MNIFSIKGRVGRAEYFWHSLIGILGLIVFILASLTFFDDNEKLSSTILIISFIVYMVSEFCLIARRFHDIGKQASNYFLLFIPLYNIFLGSLLLFKKGVESNNKYGEDPLNDRSSRKIPVEMTYLLDVVLLAVAIYFLGSQREENKKALLNQFKSEPRIGDLYINDVQVEDEFNHEILKISNLSKDSIEFHVGGYRYDRKSEVTSEIKKGVTKSPDYFIGSLTLHKHELVDYNIVQIVRETQIEK